MSLGTEDPELISAIYETALHADGLRLLAVQLQRALGDRAADAWLVENGIDFDFQNPAGSTIAFEGGTPRGSCNIRRNFPASAIPHIKAALHLRWRRRQADHSFPGAAALDAFSFGTIICTAAGKVVYANSVADALLASQKHLIVRRKDRTLSAKVPAESQQLDRMILLAATETKPGSMILSDRAGERAAMVLVTPVTADTIENFDPGHAMLGVRPFTGRAPFDADLLRSLFKLSPAQAALAIALYEGRSFENIAAARNVKVSTLRTHFSEILNRTGARGSRDLIRILGEIPPLR